jgi:hypothetical protein
MADNKSVSGGILGGWLGAMALLGFCAFLEVAGPGENNIAADEEVRNAALAPCSSENNVFDTLSYDQWASQYHNTVNTVIDAHIAQQQEQESALVLDCESTSFSGVLPATPPLEALARTLSPWKSVSTFASGPLPPVTATDLTPVLLEFVRVYECSLFERQLEGERALAGSSSSSTGTSSAPPRAFQEELKIREELATARPALEHTLLLISGMNKLQPLIAELVCLERSLTDIRNITGLLAEEASCWNRTWDGRGSLRDLQEL